MKKVLIVASVVSFIEWFNKENIEFLKNDLECEVHIACNFDYMDDTDVNKTRIYIKRLKDDGFFLHNILFSRNPISVENFRCYKELKSLIEKDNFDLIHCHTPSVSIITRMAGRRARKNGTIVMYTCHGFHFHNSSSIKNWLIYYPFERFFSRYCDYLITINKEDYNRAKKFYCKNVRYIPGVGVDINKIKNLDIVKKDKKESIGVPSDKILIISVGELIERKNHEVIIRALARINDPNIFYAIAGKGPLEKYLINLSKELHIENNIILLGFRTDVFELYHAADISAFPSKIEGLGLAGIEAMAAGVPLISSNVHGILDYVIEGETGYSINPNNVEGFSVAIKKLVDDKYLRERISENCIKVVDPFDLSNALNVMWNIYKEILL